MILLKREQMMTQLLHKEHKLVMILTFKLVMRRLNKGNCFYNAEYPLNDKWNLYSFGGAV
jgi:hypothetical protein